MKMLLRLAASVAVVDAAGCSLLSGGGTSTAAPITVQQDEYLAVYTDSFTDEAGASTLKPNGDLIQAQTMSAMDLIPRANSSDIIALVSTRSIGLVDMLFIRPDKSLTSAKLNEGAGASAVGNIPALSDLVSIILDTGEKTHHAASPEKGVLVLNVKGTLLVFTVQGYVTAEDTIAGQALNKTCQGFDYINSTVISGEHLDIHTRNSAINIVNGKRKAGRLIRFNAATMEEVSRIPLAMPDRQVVHLHLIAPGFFDET